MPIIVNKQELLGKLDFFISEMRSGKIFIYPTDTIYGIWCDATNENSINKVRNIKNRDSKLFSVIVPNFEWIEENCILNNVKISRLKEILPWKYTIILKEKDNIWTIWVRLPGHYFSDIIDRFWLPFITTSVNMSWEKPAIKISDIPESILKCVDYIIEDDKSLSWNGSTIIDMTWNKEIIIRQ